MLYKPTHQVEKSPIREPAREQQGGAWASARVEFCDEEQEQCIHIHAQACGGGDYDGGQAAGDRAL
jgi:hypothetical protein